MALSQEDATALGKAFVDQLRNYGSDLFRGHGGGGEETGYVSSAQKLQQRRIEQNQKKSERERRVDELRRHKDSQGVINSIIKLNSRMSDATKEYRTASDQMFHASKFLESAADNASDFESFQRSIVGELNSTLAAAGNKFAGSIKTLEDVYMVEEQIQSMDELVTTLKDTADIRDLSAEDLSKVTQLVADNVDTFGEELAMLTQMASEELTKYGKISDNIVNELNSKLGERLPEITQEATKQLGQFSNALAGAAKNVDHNLKGLANTFRKQMLAFREKAMDPNVGLALITKGLTQGYRDLKGALKFGDVGNILQRQEQALRMGMDPGTLSELSAANRQAALASGSMAKFIGRAADNQKEWYKLTGDTTDAARQAMAVETTLRQAGISDQKYLNKSVNEYAGQTQRLMKMTGMTADQIAQMRQEIVQSNEQRVLLARLDEKSRRMYLEEIETRRNANVALGMLPEQARRVEESLAALGKASPKERMKQAAKLQAVAGAFGIQGGERAAMALRRGFRGQGDKQAFQDVATAISNQLSVLGGGSEQQMLMGDAFQQALGGLGIEEGGPFNTRLAQGNKISEETLKTTQTIAQKNAQMVDVMRNVDIGINAVLHNPLVSIMGGVGILAANSVVANGLLTKIAMSSGGLSPGGMGKGVLKGAGGLLKTAGAVGIGWEIGTFIGDGIHKAIEGTKIDDAIGRGVAHIMSIFSDDAAAALEQEQRYKQSKEQKLEEQLAAKREQRAKQAEEEKQKKTDEAKELLQAAIDQRESLAEVAKLMTDLIKQGADSQELNALNVKYAKQVATEAKNKPAKKYTAGG